MPFQPSPPNSAKNFRPHGTPEERDLFTPRLTLQTTESQSMELTDLPNLPTLIQLPGALGPLLVQPPPAITLDRENVASIERQFQDRNLFKVTAGKTPGVARIHAEGRAVGAHAPFLADLIVTVVDKPSGGTAGSRDLIGIKDFEDGLVLGLAETALKNARIVIEKIVREPENFGLGFLVGYHKGLLDGQIAGRGCSHRNHQESAGSTKSSRRVGGPYSRGGGQQRRGFRGECQRERKEGGGSNSRRIDG